MTPPIPRSFAGAPSRGMVPAALACALILQACATGRPQLPGAPSREILASVTLHGKSLELHLAAPAGAAVRGPLVLYASGDGGWFGAAVDMFHQIARAGYPTVGFSSRSFLKIDRSPDALVNAAQLSAEYASIVARARGVLALPDTTETILTGWSRGAAFAVLAASEPQGDEHLRGVVAIGLSEGEDLKVDGPEDETDEGDASPSGRKWPFEPFKLLAHLEGMRSVVIQASGDAYLPAARARTLFGADTPQHRFYAVEARNHRFSGGKDAFARALLDALAWVADGPAR